MAGEGTFPFQGTHVPGLMCCGDSTFPGEASKRAGLYSKSKGSRNGGLGRRYVVRHRIVGPESSCKAVCLHAGLSSLWGACLPAGIGLPAVAASGAITANSMVPIWDHLRMLDSIKA